MAKSKTKSVEAIVTDKRIEAVKQDARVGHTTINQMNKVTSQLIDLVYSLESRIVVLEAKPKKD